MSKDMVILKEEPLNRFIGKALLAANVQKEVAQHVADGLVQASLRGIDSHGVRLLSHYISAAEGGRINTKPVYKFSQTSPSTGKFDGDHTFGHASGTEGMKKAIELATAAGTGHVTVYNSTHFGAAAFFAFLAAEQDMIGMSFTNATPHVLSTGATRAFLGNNPICVVAPCEGEGPFCLDMATSAITFNKVLQHKEKGLSLPSGTVADDQGNLTTDPEKVKYLMPVGDYKGFGLSMMVDIFCSLLSGMPCGDQVTEMYDGKMDKKRYLSHHFSAIRIDCFEDPIVFKKRLSEMMRSLRSEPPKERSKPVLVPGDPEKKCKKERLINGIPLGRHDFDRFKDISLRYNVDFPFTNVT